LDLETHRTTPGEGGHERELHRRRHGALLVADRQQQLVRIAVDQGEGLLVRCEVVALALPAEHVVGEQRDQFLQIARDGTGEGDAPTRVSDGYQVAIVPKPAHRARCSRTRSSRPMCSWTPPISFRSLNAAPSLVSPTYRTGSFTPRCPAVDCCRSAASSRRT